MPLMDKPVRVLLQFTSIKTWLVVWNIFYLSIQLGMSSSQLTNSIIFQRGRLNHQPDMKPYIGNNHPNPLKPYKTLFRRSNIVPILFNETSMFDLKDHGLGHLGQTPVMVSVHHFFRLQNGCWIGEHWDWFPRFQTHTHRLFLLVTIWLFNIAMENPS